MLSRNFVDIPLHKTVVNKDALGTQPWNTSQGQVWGTIQDKAEQMVFPEASLLGIFLFTSLKVKKNKEREEDNEQISVRKVAQDEPQT